MSKDLEALIEKCRAASPGPWHVNGVRGRMERQEWMVICRYDAEKKKDENIACAGYDPKTGLGKADADFIAAASPSVVEDIATRLMKAEAMEDKGQKLLDALMVRFPDLKEHPDMIHSTDIGKGLLRAIREFHLAWADYGVEKILKNVR